LHIGHLPIPDSLWGSSGGIGAGARSVLNRKGSATGVWQAQAAGGPSKQVERKGGRGAESAPSFLEFLTPAAKASECGLAQLCREKLDADPFSGHLFIFRGRRAMAIKILAYDGQGFWLAQKRLSKGF
jgi:hypothetical protein